MKSLARSSFVKWLAMVLMAYSSNLTCTAQSNVCDPAIEKLRGTGELAYRFVGPHCEGTYSEQTGGNLELELVGLTRSVPKTDFRSVSAIELNWDPPKTADVHVRAASTRYKYYYRMDVHPGKASTFHWPTSLLKRSDLSMPEIGFLAWTQSSAIASTQT